MPYIEAIALESLRMFIARAFGVPHRSIRDTTLGGYFIPKVKTNNYFIKPAALVPKFM